MIPLSEPRINGNEWKYLKDCLDTNWVSSVGSYVDLFEEKFKNYVGVKGAVVTMNGTAALTLALLTLGIGVGDEVIVPSMTFVASVNPIIYVGAKPVFVDISKDDWVMDICRIEEIITEKTKAIIPVHIYGNMVNMQKLMKIADSRSIYVIEDTTESLGSYYKMDDSTWKSAGTIGHFGAFSFNGNKIMTTGAGGMLVSNNKELSAKAKYLSNQAKATLENGAFIHNDIGYNYRMPNLLAAVGLAQLECLSDKVNSKKKTAIIYDTILKDVVGITKLNYSSNVNNCRWLYGILVEDPSKRDGLIKFLKQNQIEARPFFEPIHKMIPYLEYRNNGMENTEYISSRGLSLPCSVGITNNEIKYVCDKVIEFFD